MKTHWNGTQWTHEYNTKFSWKMETQQKFSPFSFPSRVKPQVYTLPGNVQKPNAQHTIVKLYIRNAIQHMPLPHHIGACQNTHTQVQQQAGLNQSQLNKTPGNHMHRTFEESRWSLKSLLLKLWVWYSLGGLCKDSPPCRTLCIIVAVPGILDTHQSEGS